MKKILCALTFVLLLTGCDWGKKMDNTPTKKVEAFLNKYQTLDGDVLDSLDSVISEETLFNDDQRSQYRDIMKSNYQKMTYEIKDEEVNGDDAKVNVEIEVIDYSKILSDAETYKTEHEDEFLDNDEYSESKYVDYRLGKLKEAKEKVKYTVDLSLTKVNDEWVMDDLSTDNEAKLNGLYSY